MYGLYTRYEGGTFVIVNRMFWEVEKSLSPGREVAASLFKPAYQVRKLSTLFVIRYCTRFLYAIHRRWSFHLVPQKLSQLSSPLSCNHPLDNHVRSLIQPSPSLRYYFKLGKFYCHRFWSPKHSSPQASRPCRCPVPYISLLPYSPRCKLAFYL